MTNRFPLYYESFGKPKNPCIVLITGIGAQLIQWPERLLDELVNQGFYVVVFDNRDAGLSKQYDHLGTPGLFSLIYSKLRKRVKKFYALEDMAADVLQLLNHLSIEKAHILGISMGGMIAQIFAIHYPERLASLILIGTSSGDSHLPAESPEVRRFFTTGFGKTETMQSFVDSKTGLFKLYNPYFFNEEKTRALLTKAYKRAYNPKGFKRQIMATISAKPRSAQLKQLKVKTLIIHGKVDPMFPAEHGYFLAQCIANSQLEIVDTMGHLIPEELSDRIARMIAHFSLGI